MKESVGTNAIETRALLISKRWVQAVAIVMLFGFFRTGVAGLPNLHGSSADSWQSAASGRASAVHPSRFHCRTGDFFTQRTDGVRFHLRPRCLPKRQVDRFRPQM